MSYRLVHADSFTWMGDQLPHTFEAIITDPPFGIREFEPDQLAMMRAGAGGNWRMPPAIGACRRQPLPRFTGLSADDETRLARYFATFGALVQRLLVPGGHLVIATTPLLSDLMYTGLRASGLEKRGEIVRIVKTMRGGDRPKLAETEFPEISVMPRGHWEPWGVFRSPILETTVAANLRRHGTGALRRPSCDVPFADVIVSGRATKRERDIANHPSIKPQPFLRQVVRAALPLGHGTILDPFMGSGSTIAAAIAVGYDAVGVERDREFYEMAVNAVPLLAALFPATTPEWDQVAA